MTTPLWMNLWWMLRCDAIGIAKAKDRAVREGAPMTLADVVASSPSRSSHLHLVRAPERALG
jgi:hypothetical protein